MPMPMLLDRKIVYAEMGAKNVNKGRSCLLVVDIQPDFLPGGALGVQHGDRILQPVRELMASDHFTLQVATQDWHPLGHISFASSHEGKRPMDRIELYGREQILWPDHCVQGSPGAELHDSMDWRRVSAIIRKGNDPCVDSYSAFRNNWDVNGERPRTGLAGYLRERGIEEIFICGLARDFCVKWSSEDAIDAGFTVHVLWDLTEPVIPASNEEVRRGLQARGVHILTGAFKPHG